jgi:RNA polymerase sigma-70 factor (ECF subfamily)
MAALRTPSSDGPPTPAPPTVELLELARTGQPRAWERLVRQHSAFLTHTLRARLPQGSSLDVEDLLQDTFLRAYEGLAAFRYAGEGSLRGWLKRIALNAMVDGVRDASRPRSVRPILTEPLQMHALSDGGVGNPADAMERVETLTRTYAYLGKLGELERDVWIMRYLEGMSWERILEFYPQSNKKALRALYLSVSNGLQSHLG